MRQTSIQCYNQIKQSGLLTQIRLKVMKGVIDIAPCTATELERHMNLHHNMKGTWKVLSWLREAGVVYEVGTRDCKITSRNVIEWDITGSMPVKQKNKNKKPNNLRNCIDYILKGMDQRNWSSINKEVLIKIRDNGISKKKEI